jgi:hydrogenase maturation protease
MQTQCLVAGDARTTVDIKVRFLHLLTRTGGDMAWQEAVEREVACPPFSPGSQTRADVFTFPASRQTDGDVVRAQQAVAGAVTVAADAVEAGLFRLSVRVENRTEADPPGREQAQLHALASTHTILGVRGGELVSLLDPPPRWQDAAAACENVGTWPVLVGTRGERDTMLSSPIILYDYPEIAPESPGDLFDAGEIDEILTLRILTLTDEEKRAMAALDPRGRALLERTEALTPEQLRNLHGTFREGTA